MPASSSLWSRLFSWLFRRNSEPAASAGSSPPVVTPASPASPSSTTPVPTSATPAAPAVVAGNVSPPPAMTPLGDRLPPPGNGNDVPGQSLPTEGPNLGFRKLWNNHPTVATGEVFACKDENGMPNFGNQCAILMGTCLLKSDLLHGYDKSVCWYRGHKGHTLRAREVADWMSRHPDRFGSVEIRSNVTWGAFKGRTGFICFHNFWGEGNQGDHIDLWDGTGIVRRENDPRLEGPGLADGALDYFERSEEVWFWPVH